MLPAAVKVVGKAVTERNNEVPIERSAEVVTAAFEETALPVASTVLALAMFVMLLKVMSNELIAYCAKQRMEVCGKKLIAGWHTTLLILLSDTATGTVSAVVPVFSTLYT